MSDHVQQIKDRLGIEEVVGSYVALDPAGKNMRARCPLHNERTPSFYVTPDKGIFKCFGCGKGGDIFSFIQEMEGVEFRESLTLLAERAGVELVHDPQAEATKSKKADLFAAVEIAMKWYEVQLRKTPEIVEYLTKDRGLTKETLVNFHVGYAPAGWHHVVAVLRGKGFTDQVIAQAGLAIDGDKGLYDRFRERIMFPIFDPQGRPVGFSGRIFTLSDSQTDTSRVGKYVNSPDSDLYDKSRILFGYDRAKQAMKQAGQVYVVEGQVDLLMAHQASNENTVALSGTALTPPHCKLISRFTETIILALDGDAAGLKAAGRSVRVATEHDMKVQVVVMPDGKDPADVISGDLEEWKKLVAEPQDYIDVRLERIRDELGDPHARLRALHSDVYDLIAGYQNPILRDHYLQRVVGIMGVSTEAVHQDFATWQDKQHAPGGQVKPSAPPRQAIKLNLLTPKELLVGYLEGLAPEDEAKKKHLVDYMDTLFAEYQIDLTYQQLYDLFGSLSDELVLRIALEKPEAHSAGVFVRGLVLQMVLVKLTKREQEANPEDLKEIEEIRRLIHGVRERMNEV